MDLQLGPPRGAIEPDTVGDIEGGARLSLDVVVNDHLDGWLRWRCFSLSWQIEPVDGRESVGRHTTSSGRRPYSVRQALDLMKEWNRYVHTELSEHVQLPDVYFDGNFPHYGGGPFGQISEAIQRSYLRPTKEHALELALWTDEFEGYMKGMVRESPREEISMLIEQAQIGFNTEKRTDSVPYHTSPFQFIIRPVDSSEDSAE